MALDKLKLKSLSLESDYSFRLVPLLFEASPQSDVFCRKNNKTVRQTLAHRRYVSLRDRVEGKYPMLLDLPLGVALGSLKKAGDDFYSAFLNKRGDAEYCEFRIPDSAKVDGIGIYAWTANSDLRYIGRCKDSIKKRINQGYGKIHPKNCYLDGQSTNCHLNALISMQMHWVQLWFCELPLQEIDDTERALIREYRPAWNIQIA